MVKKSQLDNLAIGLLGGILIPIITLLIVYIFIGRDSSLLDFIKEYNQKELLTKLVSLCAVPDLALFYFYINREWYKGGKGVIAAVFIIVFWVLIKNFV